MSKTKSKSAPKSGATVDNPGELPDEVTAGRAAEKTSAERFNEWEEGRILSMLKNEFGGTGMVTLQRRHPSAGMPTWTHTGASLPVDGFNVANIASMFGGGDYRARVRSSNGQIARDFSFSVDHSIPPKNPMGGGGEKKESAASLDIPAIVKALVDAMPKPTPPADNSGMFELMKVAIARPEPKGETAAMVDLIKELREESRRSEDRFLKMFEKLSERLNSAAPATSLREQFAEFRELNEMIGDGGRGEKPESFWKEIGKGAAEALAPIVKAHFAGGAAGAIPGGLALPSPVGPALAPPASPVIELKPENNAPGPMTTPAAAVQTPENMMLNAMLGRFRSAAIDAARKGKDAYDWVDNMIGMIPDSYHGSVFATANKEEWFADIFGADPEALRHVAYLNEVRNAVLAQAFFSHSKRFASAGKTAKETAETFLGWCSKGFDDTLLSLTDDPAQWSEHFKDSAAAEWIEALRLAIQAELDGEQTGGDVVAMPDTKAAAASPAAGVTARAPAPESASQKPKAKR